MRTGEPILTGMRVWRDDGQTSIIVSLIIACGEVKEDGTVAVESKTVVRLAPEQSVGTLDIPWDTFAKQYHRRRTCWDQLDDLRLEPKVYEGRLKGHHVLQLGWGDGLIVRIPERERSQRDQIDHERQEAIRLTGSYSERYEPLVPTGAWKFVLDEAL